MGSAKKRCLRANPQKETIMRKIRHGIGVAVCGVALFAAGVALADNPGHPNNGNGTTSTSTSTAAGPNNASTTTLPSQAKGYGFYCQNQSKVHAAGQKGTPFSQCVTAMAHLAHGQANSPKAACAVMSHKPDGQGGSPFSRCVSAGAKLLKNKH
jgi:hypothetical protein